MKKLLIISPYFPPSNSADMQRVRMSLPYFKQFGWQVEVVCVDEHYSEMVKDEYLTVSIPEDIIVHRVQAFSKNLTFKIGLGSIALRSFVFFRKTVNAILKNKHFDLIFFSTTQFPVCVLGGYWKRKFGIRYVIDIQDPWHSDYYNNKPKNERPPKYWLMYRMNKYMEKVAMKEVDGLIAVSDDYVKDLKQRYARILHVPSAIITFGAFPNDFEVLKNNSDKIFPAFKAVKGIRNLVYVGRGGYDMQDALVILFSAFKQGLINDSLIFEKFRFHFIGTSYAPNGVGISTILPIAAKYGLEKYVYEQTERIPFYQGLQSLQYADGLIIPGSNDYSYTASKLYPYILTGKPILGIFHPLSSAVQILKECEAGVVVRLNQKPQDTQLQINKFIFDIGNNRSDQNTNWEAFENYTAKEMCRRQVLLFDEVLSP